MSLMGAFYTGVSGINASQNALNATAHNISNIDTEGFTRQQVYQGNHIYLTVGRSANNLNQIGLGVNIDEVRYVRDYFLDKAYRNESGRSSYYSTSYEAIEEINTLFGELNGTAFQESLQNLKDAMTSLAISPADSTLQSQVITVAGQFLNRAQAVYKGLSDYQDNLNEQIKDQVDNINKYAKKIAELNSQIVKVEAGNIENANDLRDARNLILDKLSAMGRVEYNENLLGYLDVKFEGVELVKETNVNVLETRINSEDAKSGFYSVVWSTLGGQAVYDLSTPVSTEQKTDKGSLRAILDARGTRRGTYADFTEAGFGKVENSSVVTIMTMFDHLCHEVTGQINTILKHDDSDTYGCKDSLKKELTTEEYKEVLDGRTNGTYDELFCVIDEDEKDKDGNDIKFSICNLKINEELLAQPSRLNNGFVQEIDDASKEDL